MKYYSKYMDRQTVSEGLHERLLVLDPPKRAGQWQRYAAMAACARSVRATMASSCSGCAMTISTAAPFLGGVVRAS